MDLFSMNQLVFLFASYIINLPFLIFSIVFYILRVLGESLDWIRNCLVLLFIKFAYILQQAMNNLNELDQSSFESANNSDNNYKTAIDGFSRLGISGASYEENFLCTTAGSSEESSNPEPMNLVMHKGKLPFRRTNSAPMTSTPINRLKDFFEDPSKCSSMVEKFSKVTLDDSLMETCKQGLEMTNRSETRRRKEYPTLFTKDNALAIRATVSKGCLPESNNNGLKLYYQSTAPKRNIKRMGIRL